MTEPIRHSHVSILLLVAALSGCTGSGDTHELPTFDLAGGPAFPFDAHLESTDIAAGKYSFDELFEAGSDLFHTPYNGLDGVGIARLPDGTPLARFSVPPTGGKGGGMVSSQSCGECHNMPHAAAAGLASTNRAADLDKDGLPPFGTPWLHTKHSRGRYSEKPWSRSNTAPV